MFLTIVKKITKNGEKEMARLSEEQADAMRAIETEISQITDVVQNNSATAQAMSLNELVEEFSIA